MHGETSRLAGRGATGSSAIAAVRLALVVAAAVALDTTDPAGARVVGRSPVLGGSIRDLAIGTIEPNAAGGHADVAWVLQTGDRLAGIDISDPTRPAPRGSVAGPARSVGIAVVDDHLWVATRDGALVGFDVSDPDSPRPAGRLDALDRPSDVRRVGAVSGHVVLATSGYGTPLRPILHVVDVRDPQRPIQTGRLEHPGPAGTQPWMSSDLDVDGGMVWILGGYPYSLLAVDVSASTTPTVVSRLDADDFYSSNLLTVGNGRAYLTGGDGGHNYYMTSVVDVRDPAAPRVLGSHTLPRTSDPAGGMTVGRDRFWYSTRDGQLFALDTRNPAMGLPAVVDLQTIGTAAALTVEKDLGLLSVGEALLTLDLRWPQSPRPLAATLMHFYPRSMAVSGDTALVVTAGEMDVLGGELHTLDVRDPASPRRVAGLFREYDPQRVVVSGTVGALLSTQGQSEYRDNQVMILDATSPSAPTRIGEITNVTGFQDVAMEGDSLYAVAPASYSRQPAAIALVVADISDPASPRRRGSVGLTASIARFPSARIAADGDNVFLVAYVRGENHSDIVHNALHVVDASDPDRPIEVAEVPLSSLPSSIAFGSGYVFIATSSGVLVFDVRDTASPVERGILPIGGDVAVDVQIEGDLVYATAGSGGLYVFHPRLDGWPDPNLPPTPVATSPSPTATPAGPTATAAGGGPPASPTPTDVPRSKPVHLPWVRVGR